jgi:hypothetical protein
MARYQSGILPFPDMSHYNPLAGAWHPHYGSLNPLLMAALGLTLLGVLGWRLAGATPAARMAAPAASPMAPRAATDHLDDGLRVAAADESPRDEVARAASGNVEPARVIAARPEKSATTGKPGAAR